MPCIIWTLAFDCRRYAGLKAMGLAAGVEPPPKQLSTNSAEALLCLDRSKNVWRTVALCIDSLILVIMGMLLISNPTLSFSLYIFTYIYICSRFHCRCSCSDGVLLLWVSSESFSGVCSVPGCSISWYQQNSFEMTYCWFDTCLPFALYWFILLLKPRLKNSPTSRMGNL